jgi:hypothetical protein
MTAIWNAMSQSSWGTGTGKNSFFACSQQPHIGELIAESEKTFIVVVKKRRICEMRWLLKIVFLLEIIAALLLTLWAAAAIYFDSPVASLRTPAAVLYLLAVIAALIFLRHGQKGIMIAGAGFALVTIWWLSIKPPVLGNWNPDDVNVAYSDINGDRVTIHNVRNCDYRTEQDYTCQWDVRSYNLSDLRRADLFITWWGSPWIAHPIVSFDFGKQSHVAMSVQTRETVGQDYSAIRGFFRQYLLGYTVSDERDVIRLRTNYRKGEEVYIFRTTVSPELARGIFLDYLHRVNSLHDRPEWYNALTNNCTTNIAVSAADARNGRVRFDWRILLNGKMDEMLYEHGGLVSEGLPLSTLKEQAHINAAARTADSSLNFSEIIREGRVGFKDSGSSHVR